MKKYIRREPFLFQLIFDIFGPEDTNAAEVKQMTNKEFYFFLVFVTMGIFILSFLIKVFIT